MEDQPRTAVAHAHSHVPPDRKLTYQEFLSWCDDETWAEWVDGEVVMASPASE